MSIYQRGLGSFNVLIPDQVQPWLDRGRDMRSGFGMVRSGEFRFYQQGINVGANTGGLVGGTIDAIINLILDVAHVLLILGGMCLLWSGFRG